MKEMIRQMRKERKKIWINRLVGWNRMRLSREGEKEKIKKRRSSELGKMMRNIIREMKKIN
jgi:hypothetical protein